MQTHRPFRDTLRVSRDEAKNREILCGGSRDNSDVRELLDQILKENSHMAHPKFAEVFPRVGQRTLLLNEQRLVWQSEKLVPLLLAIEDVTERESHTRGRTAETFPGTARTLEKNPLESAPSTRGYLSSLRIQAEGISNDLRDTAHQLHPSVVNHLGLPAALRSLCADFSKQRITQVHLRQRFVDMPIPSTIGPDLFRVTQEGLPNVAKHSGACQGIVCLLLTNSRILVSIRDFGAGFDLAFVGAKKTPRITRMEERARLVFGTLTMHSTLAAVTRVVVEVTLTKDKL